MRPLRILAVMHDALVPPEDVSGFDLAAVDWKMEFDITITLKHMGHDVRCLGVDNKLTALREEIATWKPHIVFNMVEDFFNIPTFDVNFVAYLELLRVPYTGCNPRGLLLGRDKALCKKIMAYHGIPVPRFQVFPEGRKVKPPFSLEYPAIVKSLVKEASSGISQASVVDSEDKLLERVTFMHEQIGGHAIAEEFVPGRELYVGVIGNHHPHAFPIWEMRFEKWPENTPKIATGNVKFSSQYQKKRGIKTERASDLPPKLVREIKRASLKAYKALDLSGYARVDIRLTPDGRFYVLEANPNPQLAFGEDFAESAEHDGLSYEELLQKILNLGLSYRPDHRG
jgi:D-alanine-D-alanine ligase